MSRGPGVAQRAIKSALRDDLLMPWGGDRAVWLMVSEIAKAAGLTRQSCSRAAHMLQARRVVELQHRRNDVWSDALERQDAEHPNPRVARHTLVVRANLGVLQRDLTAQARNQVSALRAEVDLLTHAETVLAAIPSGGDRTARLKHEGIPERLWRLGPVDIKGARRRAERRLAGTIARFDPWSDGIT